MTRERRENVLLLALVCSVALHVGLMLLIRSSVMTRPALPAEKARTAPMRVSRAAPRPDPVKIDEILDLKALKDAPAAVREKAAQRASSVAAEKPSARLPAPDLETKVRAPEAAKAVFEAKAVSAPAAPVVPRTKIETPKSGLFDRIAGAVGLQRNESAPAAMMAPSPISASSMTMDPIPIRA